jgi:hypothetical protein
MALATVILRDGTIKPVSDKNAAVSLYIAWKQNNAATDAQKAFVMQVKSVHLPPSWRPEGYDQPKTSHLFHEGVEQGAYQGLPTNDR